MIKPALLLLLGLLQLSLYGKELNIGSFGAKSDTTVLSTKAIQATIDACSQQGGGRVIIPAGKYKTGTLYLRNQVSLYLERGAILYGSPNLADYPENLPQYRFFRRGVVKRALIYAEKCEHIALEGEGTIDGQGVHFGPRGLSKNDSYTVRPYLIWMIECTDVKTEGIHLRNSGLWMQHYLACDRVYIHGIDVFNHCNKNNDMIDIDGCHDVLISDCTGDTDDDGITLKSTSDRANENVVITNCLLSSHCNAMKLGTESNGGFKNIAISNLVIRPSKITDHSIEGSPRGHTGLALELVDGGVLDGVTISNIRIDGPECPIFIRLGNRARPYYEGQKILQPGVLQNVMIQNVLATHAGKFGCSITGIPGYPVRHISLNQIRIEFEGGGKLPERGTVVAEMEKAYPEFNMFESLPAYGFYIRHAQGVQFSAVTLLTKAADQRPAYVTDDVTDFDYNGAKVN